MSLNALRQQIALVVEGATAGGTDPKFLSTGLSQLDAALPSHGIPRGRLTEMLGAQGAGRTTLLRRIVDAVVSDGLWVAYIDATRTLAPRDWASIGSSRNQSNGGGSSGNFWVVRPAAGDATRGAWCADVLLRSGAFALVILDGAPVLTRSIAVRLSRLARDANAAFIVTGDERSATMLGGALRVRVHPVSANTRQPGRGFMRKRKRGVKRRIFYRARRFSITVEKGGSPANVEVSCAIGVESRLCAHPEIPDRRGVARGTRRKWSTADQQRKDVAGNERITATTAAAAPASGGQQRTLARKRRCAEPDIGDGSFLTAALG